MGIDYLAIVGELIHFGRVKKDIGKEKQKHMKSFLLLYGN